MCMTGMQASAGEKAKERCAMHVHVKYGLGWEWLKEMDMKGKWRKA